MYIYDEIVEDTGLVQKVSCLRVLLETCSYLIETRLISCFYCCPYFFQLLEDTIMVVYHGCRFV